MRIAPLILAILIISAPILAWFGYKPVRVLAPDWVSRVKCVNSEICLDDLSKYPVAAKLYDDAYHFVEGSVGPFKKDPRIIFCSNPECAHSFGLPSTSLDVGKIGIIVGPKAWTDFYVRHEMIHHRQAEELGLISQYLSPGWLIEGMAYSLSEDPRRPLMEPWQGYRSKFEEWKQKIGKEDVWKKAKELKKSEAE